MHTHGPKISFSTWALAFPQNEHREEPPIDFGARWRFGEADLWLQQDPESSPDSHDWRSVRMILTVEDPDAVFAQAVAAGGTEVSPVEDGHGWHIGRIVDPSGHHWEKLEGRWNPESRIDRPRKVRQHMGTRLKTRLWPR
jgi:hypothetical protein